MKQARSHFSLSARKGVWREATRRVMGPIVHALVERGFRHRELVDILGEALMESQEGEGTADENALSRKTGLTRAAIRRLRSTQVKPLPPALPYPLAVRLVGRWLTDAAYSQRQKPRTLSLHGARSFATLAAMVGVDPETALPALRRSGVVRVRRGRVQLLTDAYLPFAGEIEKVEILGRDGEEFLRTILHNITAPVKRTFLQRKASYDNIGAASLGPLRFALRAEALRSLHAADRKLAEVDRDRNPLAHGGKRTRVSFGVYVFEEPVQPGKPTTPARRGRRRRPR